MLAKRLLDLVLAALGLVMLSPVFVVMMLMLLAQGGGPVFFRQERPGRGGRPFTLIKFRSMRNTRGADGALLPDAARLTRLGRVLRSTSLDELPELWNVLRGEMSIVGPRPIRPLFFEELATEIPAYWQRLVVPPGITGFAQLRLTREMTWAEKLAHDFEYIADRSLRLYFEIVASTLWLVLSRPFRPAP